MAFGRTAGCALVIAASLLCAAVAAGQESLPQANPAGQSESQPPAQRPSTVTYKDGLLTVNVRAAALTEVLDQISTQARIAFVQLEDLSNRRISMAFEKLALVEGLGRLLRDYDSFMFFGVDNAPPASLSVVWVYPRGRGRGMAPVPPDAWASSAELRNAVTTLVDPDERTAAFVGLIERRGESAREAVALALGDPDERVRSLSLNAATSNGVEIPSSLLMQALNDPSGNVRFLALEALKTGPDARQAAEFARNNDPEPFLRQHAEQILEFLRKSSPQPAIPLQTAPSQ